MQKKITILLDVTECAAGRSDRAAVYAISDLERRQCLQTGYLLRERNRARLLIDIEGITDSEVTLMVDADKGNIAVVNLSNFVCLNCQVRIVGEVSTSTNMVEVQSKESQGYAITISNDTLFSRTSCRQRWFTD